MSSSFFSLLAVPFFRPFIPALSFRAGPALPHPERHASFHKPGRLPGKEQGFQARRSTPLSSDFFSIPFSAFKGRESLRLRKTAKGTATTIFFRLSFFCRTGLPLAFWSHGYQVIDKDNGPSGDLLPYPRCFVPGFYSKSRTRFEATSGQPLTSSG